MKQAIRTGMMKLLSCLAVVSFIIGTCAFASCQSADLVVYGKIFTSEGNQLAETFAVKDGKYVYVGDKKGAGAFVENGRTEVLDYTGKGLVMPGCGNGHSHYMLGYALQTVGTMVEMRPISCLLPRAPMHSINLRPSTKECCTRTVGKMSPARS